MLPRTLLETVLASGALEAMRAPCTAMACAAYSMPQAAPRRPCARSGLSVARWLELRQRMRTASQESTSSSRHIRPLCGMCCSIHSRSRGTAYLERDAAVVQIVDAHAPAGAARQV